MHKVFIILICSCTAFTSCHAQYAGNHKFTEQDTLRGTVTPERAWWDALKYDITIEPDYRSETLIGKNIISAKALTDGKKMQVDLQFPMTINSIIYESRSIAFTRKGNVFYIDFPQLIKKGTLFKIEISYAGKPQKAVNPPWDGGWIWAKDSNGNPWMSVACQGLGSSVWYPCKDHQADEPDSVSLHIVVPEGLTGVGNGRLMDKTTANGKTTYTWSVVNPINNYNVVPYIGKYVNWWETYKGEKGDLDLSFWVLEENEKKAKEQFRQASKMMKCFEYWFGPYPFYEDSYKLVESPYLGMEHQSAVAYGNKFSNGYLGKDLSGSGWGKKWDYIIIHESGHEWFGNNITSKDMADVWVHESFTTYSEVLYTECAFGKEAADDYCAGLRKNINNDSPLVGPYGVNTEGSADRYSKGANMLHAIRQIIRDDEKFRMILRGLNKDFYHQTVTSAQIENYISLKSGKDLSKIFDQYLRTVMIPELQTRYNNGKLEFRWGNCVKGFDMPVKIIADREIWINPKEEWQSVPLNNSAFKVDRNFYVGSRKM